MLVKQPIFLSGSVTETGTTAVTGQFAAIHCITATTFSTLTDLTGSGDAATGFAYPANFVLYGNFTAFTLTSGSVRAYVAAPLG
jgi:hypothetical protein